MVLKWTATHAQIAMETSCCVNSGHDDGTIQYSPLQILITGRDIVRNSFRRSYTWAFLAMVTSISYDSFSSLPLHFLCDCMFILTTNLCTWDYFRVNKVGW